MAHRLAARSAAVDSCLRWAHRSYFSVESAVGARGASSTHRWASRSPSLGLTTLGVSHPGWPSSSRATLATAAERVGAPLAPGAGAGAGINQWQCRRVLTSTMTHSSGTLSQRSGPASSHLGLGGIAAGGGCRLLHASASAGMGSRDPKSMKVIPPGGKIVPAPRGITPREPSWVSGPKKQDGWGKGGGGMPAFTPTSQLRKRKTYQKRCKFIMQTLEHEKMTEIARDSPIVPFRPGDVIRLRAEVLENRRRANWFTGVCIARRNRGIGGSFTLRSVVANVPIERTWPLYAPTIKEFEIVERRRVRRNKLYYLRDKPLRYSRV